MIVIYNVIETNIELSLLPPILQTIPKNKLHIITGNMLGDGSISYKAKYNPWTSKKKWKLNLGWLWIVIL